MAVPIRKQAADEEPLAPPGRCGVAWGGARSSIAEARCAVRAFLARQGHRPESRTSQDAQLVVSELVTNAIRHAPGPGELVLELQPRAGHLLIAVRDCSPAPPELREDDPARVGGHGLRLVRRLCSHVWTVPAPPGKRVMAVLDLRAGG
ncbi:ATP-binding protein [Streptomyces sp. NPDC051987]|uniref:ATP-binding protein n=1 Tax=Streptomyces sp. NPDC051987 TaxID=3155808 RepID=UPI00344875D2